MLIGGVDFSGLKVTLKEAAGSATAVTLNYGSFIQTIFDFTIVAFSIFLVVKAMNKMKKQSVEETPPPAPSKEETLLTEIRDILKSK